MSGAVERRVARQSALWVGLRTRECHRYRGIDDDPHHRRVIRKRAYERCLFVMRVDRSNHHDVVNSRAHPLADECTVSLVCGEPQASLGSARRANHRGHIINVGDDDGAAAPGQAQSEPFGDSVLAGRDRAGHDHELRHSSNLADDRNDQATKTGGWKKQAPRHTVRLTRC